MDLYGVLYSGNLKAALQKYLRKEDDYNSGKTTRCIK